MQFLSNVLRTLLVGGLIGLALLAKFREAGAVRRRSGGVARTTMQNVNKTRRIVTSLKDTYVLFTHFSYFENLEVQAR